MDEEAWLRQQLMPPSESYSFSKALQLCLAEVQYFLLRAGEQFDRGFGAWLL